MADNKVDSGSYLIFTVSLGLIGSCILMDAPLYIGFFCAVVFSAALLVKKGHKPRTLIDMMLAGIKDCILLFITITFIGATVSIWMSSGIVPALMYYGFGYVMNINYLLACFIITAVVSIVMGTAVGTISTIGIALIGIGKGFAIPDGLLLGAVVSGAFVADRVSPLGGLVNLTMKTVGLSYREYVKSILRTLVPSIIVVALIYYFFGRGYMSSDPTRIAALRENINKAFVIKPALLLLPVIVMVLAVSGVKPIINMGLGVTAGSFISILLQKNTLPEVLNYIFTGYKSASGIVVLDSILKGGGILPMLEVILIVAGAVALSSLLEGTNIINPIIARVVDKAKTKLSLISRTAALSGLLTIATCDQTAGIILLGRLLQDRFSEMGISRDKLSRTIAETGTTIAPLIPWNVNSIIILAITGVSTMEYAPYAVLCYAAPVIAVFSGVLKEKSDSLYNRV
ncbi:MAG: Na+/H+ antiporter NhaC family protein [Pseudomonadota bacterium]